MITSITASTCKFVNKEGFHIIRNDVFIWKIIVNFKGSENYLYVNVIFTVLLESFKILSLRWSENLPRYGNLK